jgi:hypothetical protein
MRDRCPFRDRNGAGNHASSTEPAQNKRVGSPKELAQALAWNGGIQNSIVQSIQLDTSRLSESITAVKAAATEAIKFFGSANDIQFTDFNFREGSSHHRAPDPASWEDIEFECRACACSVSERVPPFIATSEEESSWPR